MKSSLANAIKRKTHKERSQPAARLKYGLLEKHKDYVKRAKDFHRKEKTIKSLRRKAEERNPDEFYFAMEKKRTKDGVHDGRLNAANKYTQDELALMKTQDVKYLTLKEKAEAQKIERLRENLHFIGAPKQNKHVVFLDSAQEAAQFDPVAYFDTPKELLGRTFNRPRQAQLSAPNAVVVPKKGIKPRVAAVKAEKRKLAAYNELSKRMARHASLSRTAARLAYEKEIAGKGRKRKLSRKELAALAGNGPANGQERDEGRVAEGRVFKWKRERKK